MQLAQYGAPLKDLDAAAKHADAIVVRRVAAVTPDGFGSIVTVNVDRSLKGDALVRSVRVRQSSGFFPTMDWSGVVISDAENEPLLLPGQRVVLLLAAVDTPDAEFEVQSFTGHYLVGREGIKALAGNRSGRRFTGSRKQPS